MMKIAFYLSLSLAILLSSYGCGGSAEIERTQAKDGMDRAKSLHADRLAPVDFEKAQKAWGHAQTAEKEGRTDNAKVLYTSAKIFFGKAADISKSKRESFSKELDAILSTIGRNFGQVKIDVSTNPLTANQRRQVEALVSEIENDLDSINELVAAVDLVKAVATAKELQTKIYHAQLILAGSRVK
jgi:hypothetical protein